MSRKIQARFVTLPELRAGSIRSRGSRARGKRARESSKDDTARTLRIDLEITTRVFDSPLAPYKCRIDLTAPAGPRTANGRTIVEPPCRNPSRAKEHGLADFLPMTGQPSVEPSAPALPQSYNLTNLSNHHMSRRVAACLILTLPRCPTHTLITMEIALAKRADA